jgi:hypothetical protein
MSPIQELQTCCARKSYDMKLASIFAQGGFIWGTNGNIALRAPLETEGFIDTDASTPKSHQLRRPNAAGLLSDYLSQPWQGDSLSISFPERTPMKCGTCKGLGRFNVCEECNGIGTVNWYSDKHNYEADCKDCDGDGRNACASGENECGECNGKGSYVHILFDEKFPIGNEITTSARNAYILSQLGAVIEAAPLHGGFLRFRSCSGLIGAITARPAGGT